MLQENLQWHYRLSTSVGVVTGRTTKKPALKKPYTWKIDRDTTVALQKEKKTQRGRKEHFLSLVTQLMHPHPNIHPYKQS